MKTGFLGTFVISWSQTDVDGLEAAPLESLITGAAWSWHGEAVRVDGPSNLLQLDMADAEANIRKRAARSVRRLIGAVVQHKSDLKTVKIDDPLMDASFVVTNGAQTFTVTVIEVGPGSQPLLMFLNEMPPRHMELWVVRHSLGTLAKAREKAQNKAHGGGVICFTPGTRITTADGPRLVEDLRQGDRVQTRDSGPQEILWIGARRMSGARLYVMPHLRPVRIRTGALGIERPEQELLVSPEHRMLIRGPAAQELFNTSEVLVPARDLINGSTIVVDLTVREVTYIHLLLPSHQILWANNVETESFHPANAELSSLADGDRARLLQQFPDLEFDPHLYGGYARRNLTTSESAILMHKAA